MRAWNVALALALVCGMVFVGGCHLFGGKSDSGTAASSTSTASFKCAKCGKTSATAVSCCGQPMAKVGA